MFSFGFRYFGKITIQATITEFLLTLSQPVCFAREPAGLQSQVPRRTHIVSLWTH